MITEFDDIQFKKIKAMITEFDDIQFKKILAQFNDMYGRVNAIEDVVSRIKPPPKENPAKLKDVAPKHISEQLTSKRKSGKT